FFSSRRRHTRFSRDWSSDVCSSDLNEESWSTIVLIVFLSSRISPFTSTVIFLERSPAATAFVTSAMFLTCEVRLPAIEFTESVRDRKGTRLNSSHVKTSYAGFCLHQ